MDGQFAFQLMVAYHVGPDQKIFCIADDPNRYDGNSGFIHQKATPWWAGCIPGVCDRSPSGAITKGYPDCKIAALLD